MRTTLLLKISLLLLVLMSVMTSGVYAVQLHESDQQAMERICENAELKMDDLIIYTIGKDCNYAPSLNGKNRVEFDTGVFKMYAVGAGHSAVLLNKNDRIIALILDRTHFNEFCLLAPLQELKVLYIDRNIERKITDISTMPVLPKLEELYIMSQRIERLGRLNKLKKLRILRLSRNRLKQIEGMDHLAT